MGAWLIIRDVILTGTGVALLILQSLTPHPSLQLIGAGLALTAPSAISHVTGAISGKGGGGGSSSP